MSAIKAAKKVLEDAGGPLHGKELSKRILDSGLWKSKSGTPDASIFSQIYMHIKKKGEAAVFEVVAPQTFALRKNQTKG